MTSTSTNAIALFDGMIVVELLHKLVVQHVVVKPAVVPEVHEDEQDVTLVVIPRTDPE